MKEWYLNNYHPDVTSGYENDTISEYAQNNFMDLLYTDFSDIVLLFDSNLTNKKEIKCVIQGNTSDSQSKSTERIILAPIGTLRSGDYIFFEDEYWIVDGRPGNNKSYEKATLKECQYKLRWQKNDGMIIERWANITSASKTDVGKSGNAAIFLTSNNYIIVIPNDNDSQTIEGKRVFIDISDVPTKVFQITQNNDVIFSYGVHGGVLSLIANRTELNENTDNQILRICDYIDTSSLSQSVTPDTSNHFKTIISGNKSLKVGFWRKYTAALYDKSGNVLNWNDDLFYWNVISDFNDKIEKSIENNTIKISLKNDESLIEKVILLQVVERQTDVVIGEISINISDVI